MSAGARRAAAFVLAVVLGLAGCGRGVTLGVDPANADAAGAGDAAADAGSD